MTDVSAQDRIGPPVAAEEADTLIGFLDFQRDTLRWKCSGLTREQLAIALPPSSLTLAGLLKHMAVVEAGWLNRFFAGGIVKPSWFDDMDETVDNWDFTSAGQATPEQLFAWLDESIAVSDRVIAEAAAGPEGLSTLSQETEHGQAISLRWILCHLIEEYARHNGHADLIRQSIDGQTGE